MPTTGLTQLFSSPTFFKDLWIAPGPSGFTIPPGLAH
jgi:hypothetical protein